MLICETKSVFKLAVAALWMMMLALSEHHRIYTSRGLLRQRVTIKFDEAQVRGFKFPFFLIDGASNS